MKYALMLNDMREPNIENLHCVKVSRDKQELIDWYKSQLAEESWIDGKWHKSFKKDSELEWLNPVSNLELENDYWGGVWSFQEDIPDEAILQFELHK